MTTSPLWTPEQLHVLETQFQQSQHCTLVDRKALSERLNVPTRFISRWFEERRQAFSNSDPSFLTMYRYPKFASGPSKPPPIPTSSFEDLSLSPSPVDLSLSSVKTEAASPTFQCNANLPVKTEIDVIQSEPIHNEAPPPKYISSMEELTLSPPTIDLTPSSPEVSPVVKIRSSKKPRKSSCSEDVPGDIESQLRTQLEAEYNYKLSYAIANQNLPLTENSRRYYEKKLEQANKRIEHLQWELNKDPDAQLLSFLETLINSYMIDERINAKHKIARSSIRMWHGRHKFAILQYAELSQRLNDESLPEQEEESILKGKVGLTSDDISLAFERAAVEIAVEENREEEKNNPSTMETRADFGYLSPHSLVFRDALEVRFGFDRKLYRKRKSEP